MKPLTVVVTASGAPGTAALLRALRENGEREVRLVGTDMSERVGRPPPLRRVPSRAGGLRPRRSRTRSREIAEREGAAAILPQSSFDLEGLAGAGDRFGESPVLVSPPDAIHRSNDKAESYAFLRRLGPAGARLPPRARARPRSRRRRASSATRAAGLLQAGLLVRLARLPDPRPDRRPRRPAPARAPGSVSMLLEDAVEILASVDDRTELLVMELATGPERTIDGIANGREIVLGHPKTREAMRAGLAMYFVTLEDEALMELSNAIVAELGIEHFFNIQLVGDHVIEINPRISTIVYQEDLNLPYLGVKRAIGEISDDELRALAPRIRPGRTALRYFDQLEWDAVTTGDSDRGHARPGQRRRDPVGERAGAAAEGGRRAARRLQPGEAAPGGGLVARAPRRAAAAARDAVRGAGAAAAADRRLPLLLRADARAAVAPVPAAARGPASRASSTTSAPTSAARRPPSSPTASARTREIVGSYAALRWVPGGARRPARARPAAVHAARRRPTARGRSSSTRPRTARRRAPRYVIEACEQLAGRARHRRGRPARGGARALRPGRHRRRPAERRLARRLRARGDGARQAGRRAPRPRDVVERSAEGYGIRVPIVPATKDTLADALRPLVENPALRREIGAASRAYVEQVHDIDRIADRLLAIYAAL